MKLLIRVVRNPYYPEVALVTDHRIRRFPQAILTGEMHADRTDFTKQGEFFLADEPEIDNIVRALAEGNPGCEVQTYTMTASSQCPAGPMVTKKVTKDGILPV